MVSASPQIGAGGASAAVISGIPPSSTTLPGFSLPQGYAPVLCDPMPCPPDLPYAPQTPDDGPEIFGIFAIALAGGGIWKFFKSRSLDKNRVI